jgi:predicted RNase H-like nuclease (RuvC/YqgF family)
MGYGVWMAVSALIGAFSGVFGSLLFFKPKKKQAFAEASNSEALAEGQELNNVEKAIKIWREMAESLKKELEEQRTKSDAMAVQIEGLRKEIASLSRTNTRIVNTNNRIITLLDNLNHENMEEMKEKIKEKIKNDSL